MPAAPVKTQPLRPPCLSWVEYVPLGDGMYRAVPQKPVERASISVAAKLSGLSRSLIYRLYKTGFIEGVQPTPGKILILLTSLFAHIEASKDEEFWTRERKKQFELYAL